jgi:hypothetical protein
MRSDDKVMQKLYRQYDLAEMQKRLLISELYNLIDELENRPRIKQPYPFPYNGLARGINSMLDWIEKKYLLKYWAKHRRTQAS